MNGIEQQLSDEERERASLTEEDYAAAGVEPPGWERDPIPSLETWRRWQKCQDQALAHKRSVARDARHLAGD